MSNAKISLSKLKIGDNFQNDKHLAVFLSLLIWGGKIKPHGRNLFDMCILFL